MTEFRVHRMSAFQSSNRSTRLGFPALSWVSVGYFALLIQLKAFVLPFGLNSRPGIGPFLNGTLPESAPRISGEWSAQAAFPNLFFTNALGLTFIPGSSNLCVWEREGRVWAFPKAPSATSKQLILDLSSECQGWDDSGLLNLAFHPGFVTNRFVYVYYTWVKPGTVVGSSTTRPDPIRQGAYHDRLSRFTLDDSGVAIPESELVLVDQVGNSVWHNGGGLFFHPSNGFLYWADGDDADSRNTQIMDQNLFSGVFRIDVDCRGGTVSHPIMRQPAQGRTTNYFIPNDNPFVGRPGVLEEFFCLGLRNPHRMTCDPSNGRIYIGDVGESSREEIDVIEPAESGLNFQWSRIEGAQGDLPPPYIGISRGPILDYPHTDGRAVIGGYVYRGKVFAHDLGGKYIFGDNVMRIIWAMDESTTPVSKVPLCVMPKGTGPNSGTDYTGLSSFGVDADGEIYFCQMSSVGGRIYQLARAGAPPPQRPVPQLLSQTGVFLDFTSPEPAPGLIPYGVNSPLWSDGAVKQRWIAVPAGQTITFTPSGEWRFPDGTVFVKNFALPVSETNPAILRRLETRLIVRDTNGFVYGASYKWRADLSDADLVTNGITEPVLITTASGVRTQQWFYPGRQDCLTCHTPASGGVLGVNARQLNRTFHYPSTDVSDNQLRTWNHLGLLDPPLQEREIATLPRLAALTDTAVPLEQRVRSYLDSNCAHCHRPGGAHAFFDARIVTPLDQAGIIGGAVENSLDVPGAKVVVPRNAARSLLLRRMASSGDTRMPPLARQVIDASAVDVMRHWIESLPLASSALPPRWSNADVGVVGIPGEATFVNGQFDLVGSGADIWHAADAFHYASCELEGDGQVTARIVSLQQTDPWAKAGIMLRATLAPGSRYAAMLVTPANGALFQSRANEGGLSVNQQDASRTAPCWLRLVRQGQLVNGFLSIDGTEWTPAGSVSLTLPRKLRAGLAVTSHNDALLNSVLFDSVTVSRRSVP